MKTTLSPMSAKRQIFDNGSEVTLATTNVGASFQCFDTSPESSTLQRPTHSLLRYLSVGSSVHLPLDTIKLADANVDRCTYVSTQTNSGRGFRSFIKHVPKANTWARSRADIKRNKSSKPYRRRTQFAAAPLTLGPASSLDQMQPHVLPHKSAVPRVLAR